VPNYSERASLPVAILGNPKPQRAVVSIIDEINRGNLETYDLEIESALSADSPKQLSD